MFESRRCRFFHCFWGTKRIRLWLGRRNPLKWTVLFVKARCLPHLNQFHDIGILNTNNALLSIVANSLIRLPSSLNTSSPTHCCYHSNYNDACYHNEAVAKGWIRIFLHDVDGVVFHYRTIYLRQSPTCSNCEGDEKPFTHGIHWTIKPPLSFVIWIHRIFGSDSVLTLFPSQLSTRREESPTHSCTFRRFLIVNTPVLCEYDSLLFPVQFLYTPGGLDKHRPHGIPCWIQLPFGAESGRWRLWRDLHRDRYHDWFHWFGCLWCIGNEVAIKLESTATRNPQLQYEYKIYRLVKGGVGIPSSYYFSKEGNYNVMVMDLLGPSLEDMFNYCDRRFSLKTVCMLAREMILRLQYIHQKCFIHRDIKPDNFTVGLNKDANVVFLIDYGLSKRYRNPTTQEHIPYSLPKTLT